MLFIRHTLHNSLYLYYNQCWLIFYFVRWLSSIMDTICYSDILQTTMSSTSTRLQDIEPSCSH